MIGGKDEKNSESAMRVERKSELMSLVDWHVKSDVWYDGKGLLKFFLGYRPPSCLICENHIDALHEP